MNVPFLELRRAQADLGPELRAAFDRVMASGTYMLGPELRAFERELAEYCGARRCVGVGNGLDALHLILRAWGIGPGDEVLVPANTYIASWLAVSYTGATPVPVEPDPRTFNIDPARIEAAITPKTRAIMAVHLYGLPAEMDPIMRIAADRGLKVVEDAAQAHGAEYRGRRAGALGHAAGFSFYPSKNLGAFGDGGAVVTDDEDLAERVALLRNYGSGVRYRNEVQGFNSRLDELQAALLRVSLRRLDRWNSVRRERAAAYAQALQSCGAVLPDAPAHASHAWHLYVIRTRARDELQRRLEANGIGTMIHYPVPPHLQPAYSGLGYAQGDFPITEAIHREVLSLPLSPYHEPAELERAAACVIDALREIGAQAL